MKNKFWTKQIAFVIFSAMLFVFCGALTASGLTRVYDVAEAYERSSSDAMAKYVLTFFEKENYKDIMAISGTTLSRYETEESFVAALNAVAPEGNYYCRRASSNSYVLFRDKIELGKLKLSCQKGKGKYGFDLWIADRITLTAMQPQNYMIVAPEQMIVAANGVELGKAETDRLATTEEKERTADIFGNLPEKYLAKSFNVYRLNRLYNEPQITVLDSAGEKCVIETDADGVISVSISPPEDIVKELSEFGAQAACMYARFITDDAVLDDVFPYFMPESEYATYLSQFYNSWYNSHDSYSFENPVFSDWKVYDKNHVTCDISFNYRIRMGRHEYEYPSKYSMSFVRNADKWKVANLIVI